MKITLDNGPVRLSAGFQGEPEDVWQLSHILLGTVGQGHYWSGEAGLSIKSFSHGQAYYNAGGGSYLVDPNSYLILNHDQRYTINIEPGTPIVSFCIFFAEGFAEEVRRSLNAGANLMLDEPEWCGAPQVNFYERTYQHDEVLSPLLTNFRSALPQRQNDPGWINEQLHLIAGRLLQVHQLARRELEALASVRPATREELYRRLHRARDFMAASFAEKITLEQIARVACLSPNHLLRTFKQLFRQTPHQYLTQRRLLQAERLLSQTDFPVTDICLAVGFESLGSFSTLFRRHAGLSPDNFRRQKR